MFRKCWHKASQGTFTPLGVGRLATHLVMAASSSAAGPDAKRRRMRGLVGLKGVTTEALARVLADVREHGPLDLSPWQVNSFISSEYRRVSHTLMVPKAGGGHFEWPISRADTLLQYFCDECPRFRDEVGEVLARGQHSLGAILYLDEVVPGNLLRPDNKRKFWAFYLGIEEFGPSRLFQEEFWMPSQSCDPTWRAARKVGYRNASGCSGGPFFSSHHTWPRPALRLMSGGRDW